MPRFRKKPVEIEALRNDGAWKPVRDWVVSLGKGYIPRPGWPGITRNDDGSLDIRTLEGVMTCNVGDWLICGVQGEFYPCKPDIFEQTYEPVEDPQDAQ